MKLPRELLRVNVSPCPDEQTVMHQLSAWINHYNEVHPHKALGYRLPVSASQLTETRARVRSFGGYNSRGRRRALYWGARKEI